VPVQGECLQRQTKGKAAVALAPHKPHRLPSHHPGDMARFEQPRLVPVVRTFLGWSSFRPGEDRTLDQGLPSSPDAEGPDLGSTALVEIDGMKQPDQRGSADR
jgi:hypothetical protein